MTEVEKDICKEILNYIDAAGEEKPIIPIMAIARLKAIINYDTEHFDQERLRSDLKM